MRPCNHCHRLHHTMLLGPSFSWTGPGAPQLDSHSFDSCPRTTSPFDMSGAAHGACHGRLLQVPVCAPLSRGFLVLELKRHTRLRSTACAHMAHFFAIECAADRERFDRKGPLPCFSGASLVCRVKFSYTRPLPLLAAARCHVLFRVLGGLVGILLIPFDIRVYFMPSALFAFFFLFTCCLAS